MHFLSLESLTPDSFFNIIDLATAVKKNPGALGKPLTGKTMALMFAKPSTRTRISFEVGVYRLGGHAINLSSAAMQMSRGESIEDTVRVFSRYCDGLMIRTFSHANLIKMAEMSSIPIINGLTDLYHPCQALADFQTIAENRPLEGTILCYTGDANNNVCHSLMMASALTGVEMRIACPPEFRPAQQVIKQVENLGGSISCFDDAASAARGAHVLYTDVWVSMGQEKEAEARRSKLQHYQVDAQMVAMSDSAIVLHCLPARKGEEITADVFESENSRIFDQAENRLHAQMALMKTLFTDR